MSNKEKCSACLTVPEDVMVLSCTHCICLLCAFDEVRRQEKAKSYRIACHRCQEVTEIDEGLYKQLMELMGSNPVVTKKQQNILNRQSLFRQERNKIDKGFDSDLQRTCNWHPEYAIMYVCKTCNDTFICPECLINGCHKNHDANAIQKQGQKIRGRLQQDLTKVNEKIDELQKMQQARVFSIQQRRRQLQKLRNVAKQQYDGIKEAILRQESTVIAKCNELIAAHQKQEEAFKHDIAHQIRIYEDQRIDLIDLLNPLLQQSIMGQSRALQKMMMVNLVESYKKFTKVCQRDRENYIKIAEEKMEEDMEIIQSLTKKVDRISIANFYHPKQQVPNEINKDSPPIAVRKYNYPKYQKYAINPQPSLQTRPISSNQPSIKPQNHPKNNDFFKLL